MSPILFVDRTLFGCFDCVEYQWLSEFGSSGHMWQTGVGSLPHNYHSHTDVASDMDVPGSTISDWSSGHPCYSAGPVDAI